MEENFDDDDLENDFYAVISQRENQLFDELAACPLCEIVGIVNSNGVAGHNFGEQEEWTILFDFDAWRISDQSIRTEPLTLRRRVTDEEMEHFEELIEAETVIRVRARLAEQNVFGSPQAQLEEFISLDTADTELHAQLIELQNPVTAKDEKFGTLTFDHRISRYSAKVKWNHQSIELALFVDQPDEPDQLERALQVAYALWENEVEWRKQVCDYAVKELLQLKNDTWLDEDEAEVTADEFIARMALQTISVNSNGSFDFWHDDDDLFWGHSIQISGDLRKGLTQADIPG